MAITATVLENLAKSVDLRIEALNTPASPGQPQDFQIRPASPMVSPASLTLGPLGGLIPTEASLSSAIPVELTVDWGVEDVAGNSVDQTEAVFCSRGAPTSPSLDETLQTTVMVVPDFVELVRDPTEIPAKTRYITASVTLTANLPPPAEPRDVEARLPLLRYPITVPAIPVPTVAIFFAKPTLGVVAGTDPPQLQDGEHYALIVVPTNSPIGGISGLRGAFETLLRITATANQLVSLAASVSFSVIPALTQLGVGLDGLTRALDEHKVLGGRVGVAFISADRIPNLNEIDTILDAHYLGPIPVNDVEAEDTISSLVFLGPPGRQLRCFQHRNYRGEHLTVTTGSACLAIVNELANVPPQNVLPDHPPLVKPAVEQSGTTALDNRLSGVVFL